jgi:hypothetical protein
LASKEYPARRHSLFHISRTEAFPPGFRMIAHSNDDGANLAGETGRNMLTECCNIIGDEEEDCQTWDKLHFPTQTCDFLGIAMGESQV